MISRMFFALGMAALMLAPFSSCASGRAPATGSATDGHRVPAAIAHAAAASKPAAAQTHASPAVSLANAFSGRQAYAYTRAVVDFGPRPPGSAAHRRMVAYILANLRQDHARIVQDRFTAHTPKGPMPENNIIAKFGPRTGQILVLCGHYDTKIEKFHFVGANDGGSSTGLPLEAAAVLAKHPLQVPVWVVFLDGEEDVVHWTRTDGTYGSRQLAALWRTQGVAPRIHALILVDMIGDKNLDIGRETQSTQWINDFVASAAEKLGYSKYFFQNSIAIEDDHLAFLHVGIPSVDLIDATYGPGNRNVFGRWWHSPRDTMDKLSPHSFRVVGRTVMQTLQMLARQ